MRWAIPGLNTRETALVVWMGLLAVFCLVNRDIRSSLGTLLKFIVTSIWLGGLLLCAVAYAIGAVLLLRLFGEWSSEMTKVAVFWFVGFALIVLFDTRNVEASYFPRLVLHSLGLAALIAFLSNLYTFPLPVELLLIPLVVLLAGSQALADTKPEYATARTPLAWLIGAVGVVSLSYSLTYMTHHFSDVMTRDKVREFLLPVILTGLFVPFLFLTRFVVVWQTMLSMIEFGVREDRALYSFARRSVIRACGVNLGKAQLFESKFRGRLFGANSREDVTRVVNEFRVAWDRGERVRATARPPDF